MPDSSDPSDPSDPSPRPTCPTRPTRRPVRLVRPRPIRPIRRHSRSGDDPGRGRFFIARGRRPREWMIPPSSSTPPGVGRNGDRQRERPARGRGGRDPPGYPGSSSGLTPLLDTRAMKKAPPPGCSRPTPSDPSDPSDRACLLFLLSGKMATFTLSEFGFDPFLPLKVI